MRCCVLVSLAMVGCIQAQEPNSAPQKTQPEKPRLDYFTLPQFRPIRPFMTEDRLAQPEVPLAKPKLDFKLPLFDALRGRAPRNRVVRSILKVTPNGQDLRAETSPCSIPLREVQIPKDIQFTIRQFHPLPNQLGPMPNVKAPAPACDEKSGLPSQR